MNTPATTPPPHITIALCTYNGAAHLRAQLDSYLVQDHSNWSLWVSDDGSVDETRAILQDFGRSHGDRHPLRVIDGPKRGVAANYLSLLCHPEFPAGMTALSDQDDIWHAHKLSRAVERMQDAAQPWLYGAQSVHVDDTLTPIGTSSTKGAVPAFENALVQNIISGHSAVLSPQALALVRQAGVPQGIPYHDWWLYLLVSGAGGHVVVDEAETLLYRQHDGNLMGAHGGWRSTVARLSQVFGTTYAGWLDANTAALSDCADLLTPQARKTLARFAPRPRTARSLRQAGIHRQGRVGTACVTLAAALRRL